MQQPTLRVAGPADAVAIHTLVRAAYARWVPVLGREPLPMRADYEASLRLHRFDLLEDMSGLVGLIETEPRDGYTWIENVAVSPAAQGRGLGRLLLAHAETLARAAGHGELRLLTNGRMTANRTLYGRLGYSETAEEPYLESSVVYFTKRLG